MQKNKNPITKADMHNHPLCCREGREYLAAFAETTSMWAVYMCEVNPSFLLYGLDLANSRFKFDPRPHSQRLYRLPVYAAWLREELKCWPCVIRFAIYLAQLSRTFADALFWIFNGWMESQRLPFGGYPRVDWWREVCRESRSVAGAGCFEWFSHDDGKV